MFEHVSLLALSSMKIGQVSGACFPILGAYILVDAITALMNPDKASNMIWGSKGHFGRMRKAERWH